MAFRISDATIFNNAVRASRLNRFQLSQLQAQLSAGKRINSLADDPSDASRILNLRRADARLGQFERNIQSATARLTRRRAGSGRRAAPLSAEREARRPTRRRPRVPTARARSGTRCARAGGGG